ncbi:zinc ribbon domain-containing protein [Chloroflexota bacterium]
MFCGNCDSAIIGSTAKSGRYSYYQCNARAMKGKRACHGLRVAKDKLERFVLDRIKESILTEENLT